MLSHSMKLPHTLERMGRIPPYYRLSSGVRALALALVPSTITDYLALALAQAKSKLSEYL